MTSVGRSISFRTSAPKFNVRDFTDQDIDWFSQLLFIEEVRPMSKEWFEEQEEFLKKFPAKFLRPKNPIERTLSNLASYQEYSPANAQLCKTHKVLNARLIRAFFIQVMKECTIMVDYIVSRRDLPEDVAAWIKRLHGLNGLWIEPTLQERMFSSEPRHEFVDGGCEACILARIGGNEQAIYDLECSAFTRKRKNREEPRILKLIDGWMHERDMTDDKHPGYAESLCLISHVKRVRVHILEERRAKRDARKKGILPNQSSTTSSSSRASPKPIKPTTKDSLIVEDEDEGEHNDQDELATIIGFYENRQSMVGQPPPASPMHPAFQRPISPSDSTTDIKGKGRAPPSPPSCRASDAYSESVYSQPSNAGGAYDTQNPYIPPPLRLPHKTPAENSTHPAPGPPPAATVSFSKKNTELEDDIVHTEATASTLPSSKARS